MKKQYLKKIKKKKVILQEKPVLAHAPALPSRSFPYDEAVKLVRSTLDAGKYHLGQLYLEQIVEQVKNIPEPMLFLMNVHLEAMAIDQARSLVNALLEQYPRDEQVLRHCARFYQMTNEMDSALALVKKSLIMSPHNTDSIELLGILYQSVGEKNNALKAFNKALAINPNHYGALFAKAKILRSDAGDEFVARLDLLLGDKKINLQDRALLHYGLAWIYEKKDLDIHFEHLNEANALMTSTRPYILNNELEWVDRTIERYSKESVAQLKNQSREGLSPIFITALARSGTTLLEQMLNAHSQLEAVGESTAFRAAMQSSARAGNPLPEANIFAKINDVAACMAQLAREFENNYFISAAKDKRIVDKSIGTVAILGMILTVYPNAKVINLQRHPLDIIYSCYQQNFASGNNYSLRLEDLAENYKIHKRLMDHWQSLFPEQIVTVRYEDLVKNQESVLRDVLNFCGLEWEDGCLEYYKNVGLVKTASEDQVRRPLYSSSIHKWKKVERHLQPAIRVLGDFARYE